MDTKIKKIRGSLDFKKIVKTLSKKGITLATTT